jgi:hypothetical protein
VSTLDDLLALRGADLETALNLTGASADERERITGYQGLADVDVIRVPDGVRIFLRGDEVVLIYAGDKALPPGLTHSEISAAVGSGGEQLRSRQGKRARLHVAANQGVAWSEVHGDVGFVELFPATDLETYRREIYLEPPRFIQ